MFQTLKKYSDKCLIFIAKRSRDFPMTITAPGSVLIVERAVAWSLSGEALENHCLHCVVAADAPVPCLQCSRVSTGLPQDKNTFLIC